MKTNLFLYGDIAENFEQLSEPFIAAAGGSKAVIALLLQGGPGWQEFIDRYREPWLQLGAREVIPIVTIEGTTELSPGPIVHSSVFYKCKAILIL